MTGPKHRKLTSPVDLPRLAKEGSALASSTGAPYALIGGVAVQAYGFERATKDVDFAVTRDAAAAIERQAATSSMQATQLRIGGISLETPHGTLDFIDRRFGPHGLFEEAIKAAAKLGTVVDADGTSIPVVPLEYLVALKMVGVRPQDEADLAYLLRLDELDYAVARAIVERHLGPIVAKYLDRAGRLAGRSDVARDYDE